MTPKPGAAVLTVRQPWADLILLGVKPVENRTWPPPTTLPQWLRCTICRERSRASGRHARCAHIARHESHGTPDGPYPMRLWIHASKRPVKPTDAPLAWANWSAITRNIDPTSVLLGAIGGSVNLAGCHHADECWGDRPSPTQFAAGAMNLSHCSRWAEPDVYHWQFTAARRLDNPIPATGRLGIWHLTADQLKDQP